MYWHVVIPGSWMLMSSFLSLLSKTQMQKIAATFFCWAHSSNASASANRQLQPERARKKLELWSHLAFLFTTLTDLHTKIFKFELQTEHGPRSRMEKGSGISIHSNGKHLHQLAQKAFALDHKDKPIFKKLGYCPTRGGLHCLSWNRRAMLNG